MGLREELVTEYEQATIKQRTEAEETAAADATEDTTPSEEERQPVVDSYAFTLVRREAEPATYEATIRVQLLPTEPDGTPHWHAEIRRGSFVGSYDIEQDFNRVLADTPNAVPLTREEWAAATPNMLKVVVRQLIEKGVIPMPTMREKAPTGEARVFFK